MRFYVNSLSSVASRQISFYLKKCIQSYPHFFDEIVFLCIGTDRVPGDSLGPYIGYKLEKLNSQAFTVYGTLSAPIHALNLSRVMVQIYDLHPSALIIAVDASLGTKKHLGHVTIENGPLFPGAGVQKDLCPVGDISITGIVNYSDTSESLSLFTTRMATVITIADSIFDGIQTTFSSYTNAFTCL